MYTQQEIGGHYQTPAAPEMQLKSVALVQLIATVTLVLSTLVVATAVSIGLGRADVAPIMTGAAAAPFAMMPAGLSERAASKTSPGAFSVIRAAT